MTLDPCAVQRVGRRRNARTGELHVQIPGFLFAGLALTHLGHSLFVDMNTVRIFGRERWAVWSEFVVYSAIAVLFAYLGWCSNSKTRGPKATRGDAPGLIRPRVQGQPVGGC